MRADLPGDDPQTVWQNQPTEGKTMTLVEARRKARELQKKTRWQLIGNTALAAVTVAGSTLGMLHVHTLAPRFAFALAFLWILIGQYCFHRGIWPAKPPADAGLSSGFEFYREEIKRRQLLFLRMLQWSFGPVVLAIGVFIWVMSGIATSQNRPLTAMMPFCTLFVIWIVAFLLQRSRGQKELQQEAEELNKVDWNR